MSISICVLAHNEERLIERTLRSLEEACGDRAFKAHVIVNGSTDQSAAIVHRLAREDRRIVGHEFEIGDKANAGTFFVVLADASFSLKTRWMYSWGPRVCVKADSTRWARRGRFTSLKNEPRHRMMVWALVQKRNGEPV